MTGWCASTSTTRPRSIGDLAESWTVSDDGMTYTFKLKPGLKFASGNPITAEDVAYSLERAVKLDKSPAFILTQFGLTKDNVTEKVKAADDADLRLHRRQGLCAELRAQLPDRQRRRRRRQEAGLEHVEPVTPSDDYKFDNDFGNGWLKTNYAGSGPFKIREWRANEIVVLERNDNYYGEKAKLARVIYRHVKESATPAPAAGEGRRRHRPQPEPQDLDARRQERRHQDDQRAQGHDLLHQPQPEEPEPRQARSARGVQVSGRLRRDRRHPDQGHRRRSTRPSCPRACSARSTRTRTSSTSTRPRNCSPRPACRTASRSPWTCATRSR